MCVRVYCVNVHQVNTRSGYNDTWGSGHLQAQLNSSESLIMNHLLGWGRGGQLLSGYGSGRLAGWLQAEKSLTQGWSNRTLPANVDSTPGTNRPIMWGLSRGWGEIQDNLTTSKTNFDDLKATFLAEKNGTISLSRGGSGLPPPQRTSSTTNGSCTWSNHRHQHNTRSLLLTTPRIVDLPFDTGRWSPVPISGDDQLCHFWTCDAVETKACFVLECPLYNSLGKVPITFFICSIRESQVTLLMETLALY